MAMTGADFKRTIKKLGLSQAAAARFFGFDPRQSRRIIKGDADVSMPIEKLLKVMLTFGLTVEAVNEIFKRKRVKSAATEPKAAETAPPA